MPLTDEQLLRYSRHILLEDIGIEGQERICQSHVLIIGAGGLGSAAALYLAAAGVGTLTLVDDDHVELTNLQRQIAHTTQRVGQAKVASAKEAMQAINPQINIHALCQRATPQSLIPLALAADVVLDCSDNFATRHAINAACVLHHKPLVSGSAIGFDGQLSVYHSSLAAQVHTPCYACIFPADEQVDEVACSTLGVLGPVVGMVGAMQATEALKQLAGIPSDLLGKLLLIDAKRMSFELLHIHRNPKCRVCSSASGLLR